MTVVKNFSTLIGGQLCPQTPSGYACELLDRVSIVGYVVVLARYKAYKEGWKNVAFWEKFFRFLRFFQFLLF